MLWVWIGGVIVAAGLTWWARWLARRPAAPRWLGWVSVLPGLTWATSVAISGWFTWRAFADLASAPASEKSAVLAANITWAMNAVWLGALGLGGLAALLALVAIGLRRRSRGAPPTG